MLCDQIKKNEASGASSTCGGHTHTHTHTNTHYTHTHYTHTHTHTHTQHFDEYPEEKEQLEKSWA